MRKNIIEANDILRVIRDLAGKNDSGTATTKEIVLECGERFPDVHLKAVLSIMREMKREGLLKYEPSSMMWWLTADGKRKV